MSSSSSCHIFLIRHASAGKRTAAANDRDRHLDDTGLRQAKNLARSLSAFPIDHIIASPAVRCSQTVQPLADELGLTVEISDALWEGRSVADSLALVQRLLTADSNAALCSHGDVIPALLGSLERTSGVVADGGCAKGSVWVLEGRDGAVVSARYLGQP